MTRQLAIQIFVAAYYKTLHDFNNCSTSKQSVWLNIENLKELDCLLQKEAENNIKFKENRMINHEFILCGKYPGFIMKNANAECEEEIDSSRYPKCQKECKMEIVGLYCLCQDKYSTKIAIFDDSVLWCFAVNLHKILEDLYFTHNITTEFIPNISVSNFLKIILLFALYEDTQESFENTKNKLSSDIPDMKRQISSLTNELKLCFERLIKQNNKNGTKSAKDACVEVIAKAFANIEQFLDNIDNMSA